MAKTKYIKIQLGEPREGKQIFVREKDSEELKKALKSKNTGKIINSLFNLMLGSPDGMQDLTKSIHAFSFITSCRNIKVLENFRDLVNYEIRKLKKVTPKSRKVKNG